MIPKSIHYCWLSGDPVHADYQRCMDTWREKLTGYEFVLWDTTRFDINATLWTKQALETGLYACAADYIRLYAVYHCGGIYLDMDMEVIRPFGDLLNAPLMLAYENHISGNIEAGCFGAEKEHPYIRKCMEYIEARPLFDETALPEILKLKKSERHEFIDPPILPDIMRQVLQASPEFKNYPVYPHDYFTAKNVVTGDIEKTGNTFTIHHFGTEYHSEEWRKTRKGVQKINKVLGKHFILSRIIIAIYYVVRRIHSTGLINALTYYYKKYITKQEKTQ